MELIFVLLAFPKHLPSTWFTEMLKDKSFWSRQYGLLESLYKFRVGSALLVRFCLEINKTTLGFSLGVSFTSPACFLSLFPTMPRHNYHKVAPLVKSLCAKHGLQYINKPILKAFGDIIR